MGIEIPDEPELNAWIEDHPDAAEMLEVMLEAMPGMSISWPGKGPFDGIVNLPARQILYRPDLPNPVIVYETMPTSPTDEPIYVVGANGLVTDLRHIEETAQYIDADELRQRLAESD